MMLRRGMAALLLACAAVISVPAQSQVAATHEVRRGDTLFGITRKTKHDGVSRNQMILAIWRANRNAFPGGNINQLEIGTVLAIPARETVAAIEAAEADREVRALLASRPAATPAAQVAVARPEAPAAAAAAQARGLEQATRRYQEGLALERKGDDQGALGAFLEAGEGGYGLAQRKLGQIYDKGNSAVRRDLQASILWYQKARAQGVSIDKQPPRILPK
jgi:FimV-like protein